MHTETYEQIYQRMKTRWQEESGAVCDEASDIAIRLRVLAGEIYNMQTETEWLKRQMFPATATGVYLDYFAEQRGLSRREAVKARGAVSFRVAHRAFRAHPRRFPAVAAHLDFDGHGIDTDDGTRIDFS